MDKNQKTNNQLLGKDKELELTIKEINEVIQAREEIDNLKDRIKELEEEVDYQKDRIEELEEEVDELEEEVDDQKDKIEELENEIDSLEEQYEEPDDILSNLDTSLTQHNISEVLQILTNLFNNFSNITKDDMYLLKKLSEKGTVG